MSSTPQPLPETPSKPVAVVKPRTPLPGGPTNGTSKKTMESPDEDVPEASKRETQQPSSSIPIPEAESAPASKPAEVDSQSRQENEHSDMDEEEEEEDESHLADFDWSDWEQRYTSNLKNLFAEELEIIEEFDAYATSFSAWAKAGAQRDNARMLRTRKEFTHLAESALEDKANHYKGVVDAFQAAMNMLRRQ
ncbi:uncharacterized protein RCO7_05769 [Rhynchosporium graminicola]|uniref:Uncharacterized protein n=1 Tax=Rhynchosporium graminicola TaxID=2792576 RepID=A0A1E1KB82_9HELO|nr:uncharacterized protein RCO7_05769 [Rhynchosporium commune]